MGTHDVEGTARDLMAIPFLGRILLVIRGAQRMIWGFSALYMTFMVLSGSWRFTQIIPNQIGETITVSDTQKMFLFICIDLLVLATLFGERAIRNILPIVIDKLWPIISAGKQNHAD